MKVRRQAWRLAAFAAVAGLVAALGACNREGVAVSSVIKGPKTVLVFAYKKDNAGNCGLTTAVPHLKAKHRDEVTWIGINVGCVPANPTTGDLAVSNFVDASGGACAIDDSVKAGGPSATTHEFGIKGSASLVVCKYTVSWLGVREDPELELNRE